MRFLPVNPSFVAAFAALKVSLWRRMSADATVSFILTKRQHPHFAWLVRMFSLRATLSFSRCVFVGRKRIIIKLYGLLYTGWGIFSLAQGANTTCRRQISLQYYSRASVNITAPQGARKRCLRRKHSSKRSAVRMLSPHRNNNSVFSRTCAGKRHLKSRERGDRKGANGGKREGERSEQESVVPRQKTLSI